MRDTLRTLVVDAIADAIDAGELRLDAAPEVELERPRDPSHGDWATNVALKNAKAAGIIIYTVALGNGANTTLLSYCASKPSYAYAPVNGSDLTSTFQAIAASINKLRIAE